MRKRREEIDATRLEAILAIHNATNTCQDVNLEITLVL
jgi:hypothetical protein